MSPVLDVAPEAMRVALQSAYRLKPDGRFLAAVAEVPRLLNVKGEAPVEAAFEDGRWNVRHGSVLVGSVPELPGFADYESVLVRWARAVRAKAPQPVRPAGPNREDRPDGQAFLWPRASEALRDVDRQWMERGPSPRLVEAAARSLARLCFQMTDSLEIGDVLPARGLAALAIARTHAPASLRREEVLLAHAMGYTRHAADVASSLASSDPVRLFAEMSDEALASRASEAGASPETRFLALERIASRNEYDQWLAAKDRLFGPDDAVGIAPGVLHVRLQAQVEDLRRRDSVAADMTRSLLRELGAGQRERSDEAQPQDAGELEMLLETALARPRPEPKGPFWDDRAIDAWYRSAVYSGLLQAEAAPRSSTPIADALRRSYGLPSSDVRASLAFVKKESAIGAQVPGRIAFEVRNWLNGDSPEMTEAARLFVRRADARVRHRERLALIAIGNTYDLRLAEKLARSVLSELSDMDRHRKAVQDLFLGDYATARRLVLSPRCSAQDAMYVLYSWTECGLDPEGLESAFEETRRRHPESWELTYEYLRFLRGRQRVDRAYATTNAWLARFGRPGVTGFHHAHIALAWDAILLGKFDEALSVYRSLGSRGNRNIEAMALNGLGRKDEAEKLIREAAAGSTFDEDLTAWLRILWQNGKDDEVAGAVQASGLPKGLGTWCHVISPVFGEVFLDAPPERPVAAIRALREKHVSATDLMWFARPFATAGKWETAVKVQAAIEPPSVASEERLMESFTYMKRWKGAEAALQWLKQVVPPAARNPLGIKAYNIGEYELLWTFIEKPDPATHPEWVWLVRAAASARLGGADAHRPELISYYSTPTSDPYHVMGRYLVGLATEKELFAIASDQARRGEVAYYVAVKAHGEKRYEDASDWYRVCMDVDSLHGPRAHAARTLIRWTDSKRGLSGVRAEGL